MSESEVLSATFKDIFINSGFLSNAKAIFNTSFHKGKQAYITYGFKIKFLTLKIKVYQTWNIHLTH
jgi:hypothetical protein